MSWLSPACNGSRIKATINTKDDNLCNNNTGKCHNRLLQPVVHDTLAVPICASEIVQRKYPFGKTHLEYIRVPERDSKDENSSEA